MNAVEAEPEPSDRVSRLLGGVARNRRTILTPEGIRLRIDVAEPGERLTAFLLDVAFWLVGTLLLYVGLAALLLSGFGGSVAITLILFIAFTVRNLYFIYFELLWRGATPGKRLCGLRVIDRRGGPLESGAVVARNLTREVEIFLPVGLLLSTDAGGVETFLMASWLLLFTALPLFNRDRLRAGDLIGGTLVIAMPHRRLLPDIADPSVDLVFTPAQLGAYGTYELQVLEELLRRPDGPGTYDLLADVSGKIALKIGWPEPVAPGEARTFLSAFYKAERAHLERARLVGRTRADQHG